MVRPADGVSPIRGVEAVKAATGLPPLAIIPDYERKPNFIIRVLDDGPLRSGRPSPLKAFMRMRAGKLERTRGPARP